MSGRYVKIVQEDGRRIRSSPTCVFDGGGT